MVRHLVTLARLITNALAAALAVTLLLLALLLALNPGLDPGAAGLAGALAVLFVAYGLPVAIGLPVAFTVVRFFAERPLRIGWIHLKSTLWFLVVGVGVALGVWVWNYVEAGDLLDGRARRRLAAVAGAMLAAWAASAALAASAQWAREAGDRRRRGAAALCAAVVALAFLPALVGVSPASPTVPAPPVAAGGRGPVVLLGIEGASFSAILPLVAEGDLPHFDRLLKDGANGPLRSIRPCRSTIAWASLATGRLPASHGIRDLRVYRLPGVAEPLRALPSGILFRRWLSLWGLTSRAAAGGDLRFRPLWQILDRFRAEAAFLGWPLASGRRDGTSPETGATDASRIADWVAKIVEPDGGPPDAETGRILRAAVAADLRAADRLVRVASSSAPRTLAAHLPGLGSVAAAFPGVRAGEQGGEPDQDERWTHVVARYYEFLDHLLGEVMRIVPPDGHLIVVSAYGAEPTSAVSRRLHRLAALPAPRSGHDGGPAGILLLGGPGASAGKRVEDLRVTDVVPLTLYILGLPVGRDLDGRLPRRLLDRGYLARNPITIVATLG